MLTRRHGVALGAAVLVLGPSVSAAAPPDRVVSRIEVRAPRGAIEGQLRMGTQTFSCALGRSGIVSAKVEGDGGTPQGAFPLREIFWRPDRLAASPSGRLAKRELTSRDGWCDAPGDPAYNRHVNLPFAASHEALFREDHLYDALAVIGYNDHPVVSGAGSAIFLHVARGRPGAFHPTAGCVALEATHLLEVLSFCGPETVIDIGLTETRTADAPL